MATTKRELMAETLNTIEDGMIKLAFTIRDGTEETTWKDKLMYEMCVGIQQLMEKELKNEQKTESRRV